tara:strand:- start:198 stop:1943 length:1746 start_codon:yes stop_codon:yes gene_type:complete
MSVAKLIGKQIFGMVKDSGRVQSSVIEMKDKIIKESLNTLKKSGIDPAALPFDPLAVLNGTIDPASITVPEVVCSVPPIPPNRRDAALGAIDNTKSNLTGIIENSNKLKSALVDLQSPLQQISATGQSLEGVVDSVSNAIKVIKAIPIPTAFGAPAVALPVKVLTILSSSLIRLDKIVETGKGTISFIGPMVKEVSGTLNQTIQAVGSLESAIGPALSMLTLVQSTLELGPLCPDVTQDDIDEINDQVAGELNAALLSSGDNSLELINIEDEEALIASFPFFYKGFLLELVNNPNNEFPFPSRKIRATRDFTSDPEVNEGSIFVRGKFNEPVGEIILYNDPGGQARYSFSTSVSILVKEMKFKLDNYLKGINLLALPTVTDSSEVRGKPESGTQEYFNTRPNPQIAPPGAFGTVDVDLVGGSDDPPSPTGSQDPPLPPAFYFSSPTPITTVNPNRLIASGSFVVSRPVKIRMETYGGSFPLDGNSRAFLRIYKQGVPGYSFFMEEQIADDGEFITTQNNPQGYYASTIGPKPEYWPINPTFANGTVASNLGIFQYELELISYDGNFDGSSGNYSKFEIEAQ